MSTEIREALEAAMRGDVDEPEAETPEIAAVEEMEEISIPVRARDDKGRFAAADGAEPVAPETSVPNAAETPEVADPAAAETALSPPNGWSAAAKGKWHELPPDIQAEVQRREADIHKQASKSDDERNFGRELSRVINPYLPQIQAEGGTPAGAVQSLLNTAYVLRTAPPEQKRQLLLGLAQQYGVDLGQPTRQQPQITPELQPLYQELQQLRGYITQSQQQTLQQQQAEQNRLNSEVQSELQTFSADPKHAHFEAVKAHMAALLREGAAKDLQDAYEQATWANSDIRATLLATQRAEEEQKRRVEAKRKADEAKRKGTSITGGPGFSNGAAPESRSLRDDLEAQFAAQSGGV